MSELQLKHINVYACRGEMEVIQVTTNHSYPLKLAPLASGWHYEIEEEDCDCEEKH